MDEKEIKKILAQFKGGKISTGQVIKKLKFLPYKEMGFAKIDTHRTLRMGFPEVIYGPGKTLDYLTRIIKEILKTNKNFIATKIEPEVAQEVKKEMPFLLYFPEGKILTKEKPNARRKKPVAVLAAGTSDLPIAEEAGLTCEILGNRVIRIYDVGVAGIHRLFGNLHKIENVRVLIVVAGMEGALPGVVGGLVNKPVIAVPTSVGYGASFAGLAPLLTMLNSCSPNVAVVNINNGFGAGFFAHLINSP